MVKALPGLQGANRTMKGNSTATKLLAREKRWLASTLPEPSQRPPSRTTLADIIANKPASVESVRRYLYGKAGQNTTNQIAD